MPKWLSVPSFVEKLGRHQPVTYKQVLDWAESGALPTWPRFGQERYKVKQCKELIEFLLTERKLAEHQVLDVLTGWKAY